MARCETEVRLSEAEAGTAEDLSNDREFYAVSRGLHEAPLSQVEPGCGLASDGIRIDSVSTKQRVKE